MFKDFSNCSLINVSAVSEFPGNCHPPVTGMGGCKSAAETARAVPARATAHSAEPAASKARLKLPTMCLSFPLTHTAAHCWMYGTSLTDPGCSPCAMQQLFSTAQASFQPIRPAGLPSWTHISQKGAWLRLSPQILMHPLPPLPGARGSLAALPGAKPIWSLLNSGAQASWGRKASGRFLLPPPSPHSPRSALCQWLVTSR